jgi:hypothetical protein
MSRLLTFEDGEIHLAGELVPGIFSNLRVDGKVRFDEQKIDGSSGKKKTPVGFDDCGVVMTLVLLTDESACYDKLARINAMFKSVDDKANPKVLDVTNRHLLARGVRQVVFARLESAEDTRTDEIKVTLGFTEHNPPIIRAEAAQAKTPTPAEVAAQSTEQPEDFIYISGH